MFLINETLNPEKIPQGKEEEFSSSMLRGLPAILNKEISCWWDPIRIGRWRASC